MYIQYKNIILRDMLKSDIDDYVRWFTDQTEWALFDAPWEPIEAEESSRKDWEEYYNNVKNLKEDTLRWKFELEVEGKHIGWVSSYFIDSNYDYILADGTEDARLAIGIDICEKDFWSKGIGTNAFNAFIKYYLDSGIQEIYTQTWSGNTRMLRVIEKVDFHLCHTKKNFRVVEGKQYDALTFIYKRTA